MSAISTELPPRYLRTKEAAQFLSLSARTLEKHRTYGTGPAYHKLGGRVVYAIEDLQAKANEALDDYAPAAALAVPRSKDEYQRKILAAVPSNFRWRDPAELLEQR